MTDEDDLYKYYERMDEQRQEEEEEYDQQKRADLDAAWLHGVDTGDYSEFHSKLNIDPPTGLDDSSSPAFDKNEALIEQWARLRTIVVGTSSLPAVITSNWVALLDQMNLQDPPSALTLLSSIKNDYETAIELYRPQPRGGLNMNVEELFRFAKEVDQIAAEMNWLGMLLGGLAR